ncbi:hypothetical protein Adt_25308 [Abeliophyllum distichum]|uniref:Uncharacterized protein n=1 Tax=Abeliophyllum distichum TaxID=126358 RepID=A0ABD1SG95_9LAMI
MHWEESTTAKGSARQILVGHDKRAHHGREREHSGEWSAQYKTAKHGEGRDRIVFVSGEVNGCCELGHNKFGENRKATQWGLEQGRERDSALEGVDAGGDKLGHSRLEKPRREREMGLVYQKWMVGG